MTNTPAEPATTDELAQSAGNSSRESAGTAQVDDSAAWRAEQQRLADYYKPTLYLFPELTSQEQVPAKNAEIQLDYYPRDIRHVIGAVDELRADYIPFGLTTLAIAARKAPVAFALLSTFYTLSWLLTRGSACWDFPGFLPDSFLYGESWYSGLSHALAMAMFAALTFMALPRMNIVLGLVTYGLTLVASVLVIGLLLTSAGVMPASVLSEQRNECVQVAALDPNLLDEVLVAVIFLPIVVAGVRPVVVPKWKSSSVEPRTVNENLERIEQDKRKAEDEDDTPNFLDKLGHYYYYLGYKDVGPSEDKEKHRKAYVGIRMDGATPYPVTAYARVQKGTGKYEKLIAIQYWFAYFYNDWSNSHELDWEQLTLVVSDVPNPPADETNEQKKKRGVLAAGYSQHQGGAIRFKPDVQFERFGEFADDASADSVSVYVAKGSHANYPAPGRYRPSMHLIGLKLSRKDLEFIGGERELPDWAPERLREHRVPVESVRVMPDQIRGKDVSTVFRHREDHTHELDANQVCALDFRWLNLRGLWGNPATLGGDAGPASPPDQRLAWEEPFRWLEECEKLELLAGRAVLDDCVKLVNS